MDYSSSSYINHFIQPDTLIPNPANPQSLDRFSYVYNNPIRFNDPTGHMCREDGKGCDGSFREDTKIGNKIINGAGIDTGKSKKPKGKEKNKFEADPWEYSTHVTEGFHVGPAGDIFVPEYNSDDYNGVPFVSNRNVDENFWIAFNLKYNESIGTTISNIRTLNQSDYPIFLNNIYFESGGKSFYPQFENLGKFNDLSQGLTFVPDPPKFNGDNKIVIKFELGWTVHVGQGPFQIYPDYEIVVPSLPNAKNFIETGRISSGFPIAP